MLMRLLYSVLFKADEIFNLQGIIMKYLFFDIECANCFHGHGKICSFGYVITDTEFNILEKKDILMNPHSRFYLFGHRHQPGITLAYDESEFNSSPDFNHYYKEIRTLLTRHDLIPFGFAVMSDAGFIKSECERFNKPIFDYTFYDVQRMYTDIKGLENTPGLIKCAHEYGVNDNQDVHKSDDDSYFTMRVLKGLTKETGLSVQEIIESYPLCRCWSKGGLLESEYIRHKEEAKAQKLSKMEKLTNTKRANWLHASEQSYKDFSNYYKRVYVDRRSDSPICGKKVCISSLYEEYHFNEMMNIVSLLAKNGAKYTRKSNNCDIFVEHTIVDKNGKEYICYRKERLFEEGENILLPEFIPLEELLDILDVTEDDIAELDKSKLAPLKIKRAEKKHFSHS